MSHHTLQHRRTHNLLLINKLLSHRDAATPFTLVLDSLEQTAKPLIREVIRRANAARTNTVFLGFETIAARAPSKIDVFVPCYGKSIEEIERAVREAIAAAGGKRHTLLIIDSLHPLCTLSQQPSTSSTKHTTTPFNLTHFLSSLIAPSPTSTTTSLFAIYHTDIPLPPPQTGTNPYHPTPLTLLTYLATTLLTPHPLASLLSSKSAQERSLASPLYGLDESKEGVLLGLYPGKYTRQIPADQKGVVIELEHRRKSGRGVREWFFLPSQPPSLATGKGSAGFGKEGVILLLDDHPLFRPRKAEGENSADEALAGMTFELGLTERQRQERDGVVLPYFDAQRDGGVVGPGEGGRILYDLGAEDDFDEEEDEI